MLTKRSIEKEWLDLGPEYYSPQQYQDCQKKLFFINNYLGFFRNTVRLLKKLPHESTLLDFGCGSGLFLLHLSKYFPQMNLIGHDISPEAIQIANKELSKWKHNNPKLKVAFYLDEPNSKLQIKNCVDIILLNLVCHHLTDEDLIESLITLKSSCRKAIVIHDLQRHRIAYYLYSIFSRIFLKNSMVIHDGLLSIKRGFLLSDWKMLLQRANINHYEINWRFPFIWQIIIWNN